MISGGVLVPDKWKISIDRSGDKAELYYEEWFNRPNELSEIEFRNAVEATARLMSANGFDVSVEFHNDAAVVTLKYAGEISFIADCIVMEFLHLSNIGDARFGDLINAIIVASMRAGARFGYVSAKKEDDGGD